MKDVDTEKFGKFIAACRRDNHMTQNELAHKLQVTGGEPLGERPGTARPLPVGAAGQRPAGVCLSAVIRGADGKRQPERKYAEIQALCPSHLRQPLSSHRERTGRLLRDHPAAAGAGSSRRCTPCSMRPGRG